MGSKIPTTQALIPKECQFLKDWEHLVPSELQILRGKLERWQVSSDLLFWCQYSNRWYCRCCTSYTSVPAPPRHGELGQRKREQVFSGTSCVDKVYAFNFHVLYFTSGIIANLCLLLPFTSVIKVACSVQLLEWSVCYWSWAMQPHWLWTLTSDSCTPWGYSYD